MTKPYLIGWFSTGRDRAARDLLAVVNSAIEQGGIQAELAFVFCNRERGESGESDSFMQLVRDYHIPLVCFSYREFKAGQSTGADDQSGNLPRWRLDYDREVMDRLKGFNPDLCVLAGYMLVVGKEMCRRYNMINLHPAAPGGPAGTWQEVIWKLIDGNARETGVMMHLVTPELDKGPPVAYCTFPIRGGAFDGYWEQIKDSSAQGVKKSRGEDAPLFKLIRKEGLTREFPLILSTIKAFSQGKIRITPDKRVVDSEGNPIEGYDLTHEINERVGGANIW